MCTNNDQLFRYCSHGMESERGLGPILNPDWASGQAGIITLLHNIIITGDDQTRAWFAQYLKCMQQKVSLHPLGYQSHPSHSHIHCPLTLPLAPLHTTLPPHPPTPPCPLVYPLAPSHTHSPLSPCLPPCPLVSLYTFHLTPLQGQYPA